MAGRAESLAIVLRDFGDESAALDGLLATLDDDGWLTPTPAEGWDVRDSVAHLAIGDELALECVAFDRNPKVMDDGLAAVVAGADAAAAFEKGLVDRGRTVSPSEVHAWWRRANAELREALAKIDPDRRLPWGGNRMSTVSFVAARLMETWAHGVDCFDAAGVEPIDTDRLRHVAQLALRALPYAFLVAQVPGPGPVRLELKSRSGEAWSIGPDDAPTVIRGTASDWCRVATHRDRRGERNHLEGEGPDAADVLSHVQAYL
ncbi:MAG: maleylpyruvate isomerase family mycothiol-dependent enzyme [Actinomycetota bacterium]